MKRIIILYFIFLQSIAFYAEGVWEYAEQWNPEEVSAWQIQHRKNRRWIQVRTPSAVLYTEEYTPSVPIEDIETTLESALPEAYAAKITGIAKQVWPIKRRKELKEEILTLLIYLSDDGTCREITFFLPDKTTITPEEIGRFEKKLKQNRIKLRNNKLKGSNYMLLPFTVNFLHVDKEAAEKGTTYGKYNQWHPDKKGKYEISVREGLGYISLKIINKLNYIYLLEPKIPPSEWEYCHLMATGSLPSGYNFNHIAKEIWNKERIKELSGESLHVLVYFSDAGRFQELEFSLSPDTRITPEEIALLERKIKSEILPLRYINTSGCGYTSFAYHIPFKKLAKQAEEEESNR